MSPSFNDYVALIYNRFTAFVQSSETSTKHGRPFLYKQESMIVFFMWMQFKRIYDFKAQWRWLTQHEEQLAVLGWSKVPHRTTLSRRYKRLFSVLQDFTAFLGETTCELSAETCTRHLNEDKSLFKAQGNVWHQKHRRQNYIPKGLRNLDTDATWSKSGYHGWVYGYGLHLTSTQAGFPVLMEVETGSFSEKEALTRKESWILKRLKPETVCGDDAYTKALRIRRWAKEEVILVTPALRWKKGRYAQAYRRFIRHDIEIANLLKQRKTAIEPVFDLIAKLIGTTGKQKQLFKQTIQNVRTHIALGVLSLQIAMIANSIWNLPFRTISQIKGAFA